MKLKRGFLFGFLIFLFIKMVSAQFGGYGSFSIPGFLDIIGPENLTFLCLFIIFFAFIFFALGRVLKDHTTGEPHTGVNFVIAFAASIGAAYYLYNSGFNITGLFSGLGVDQSLFVIILLVVALVGLIYIGKRVGFSGVLMSLGAILILLAMFTGLFYEQTTAFILGIIFLLIGFFLWWRKRKKKVKITPQPAYRGSYPNPKVVEAKYEEIKEQQAQAQKQRTEEEKLNLARKIGVKNLEREFEKMKEEYEKGVKNAEELHKQATRLGWNKTKEGNEYYKAWYRQYNRLDVLRKNMKEVQDRIEHLRRQIK